MVFIILATIAGVQALQASIEGGDGGNSLTACILFLFVSWMLEPSNKNNDTPALS